MPRRPALLTPRLPIVALLLAALPACRSAVAPPSGYIEGARSGPVGILPTSPHDLLRPACPRRECPMPSSLIAGLEERMLERLDKEREQFLDGFALLRAQRDRFLFEIDAVVERRRQDEDDFAAACAPENPPEAQAAAAAGLAVAAPVTCLLDEVAAWVRTAEGPGVVAAAPAGAAAPDAGPPPPRREGRPARAAPAQVGTVREGQWILPVVRMMARLRARFAAVAGAQGQSAALARALRSAEARLRDAIERLPSSDPTVPDDGSADAGGDIGDASPRDAPTSTRPGSPEARAAVRAAAVAEARAAARAAALADLRLALDALETSRPPDCGTAGDSSVCRPSPVDVWTGSEFTLVDPQEEQDVDAILRILDRFLHDG